MSANASFDSDHRRLGTFGLYAGLAFALLFLLVHIRTYWFLTDDAFISFRYARNLHDGYGLVFNPGFERVEGYTDFLWVILLAAVQLATGWAPHQSANVLSSIAGVTLWALVIWHCARRLRRQSPMWVLFPALWLALNRSFAVWCTSGLETKLFELLVVSGVVALDNGLDGFQPRWTLAGFLFALAALTRPDGILIGACALSAAAVGLWRSGRIDHRSVARSAVIFVLIVAAHFVFRWFYYGETWPNSYYAKLDGESWWNMGGPYLRAFLLEYGAAVWLPLVFVGATAALRGGALVLPLVVAAVVLPHSVYVAYCGGDHFEYRPIDLYFPLFAILLVDGAAFLGKRSQRVGLVVALLSCAAIVPIPLLTHVDFTPTYIPGYPGIRFGGPALLRLAAQHQWLASVPGVRAYGDRYNQDIGMLTKHFIGLRQEEHRLFLGTVLPDGEKLAKLMASDLLPADTYVAMPCVGAIPYFSNLHTLDVLGLTDRQVAHQVRDPLRPRTMAHSKEASDEYMVGRGVDIISVGVHVVSDDPSVIGDAIGQATDQHLQTFYISERTPEGWRVFGRFPGSLEHVQRRLPRLHMAALRVVE